MMHARGNGAHVLLILSLSRSRVRPRAPPSSFSVCREMEEAGAAATPSLSDIPDTRTSYEKKWDEQVPILVVLARAPGSLLGTRPPRVPVRWRSRVGVFVAMHVRDR